MHLSQDAVTDIDEFLLIGDVEHSLLLDLLIDERSHHVLAVFDDLQQRHVELHLLEAL